MTDVNKTYPTPFYLYDEKGIRENARRLKKAFSWNQGFKEYFAVKATPNPFILKILHSKVTNGFFIFLPRFLSYTSLFKSIIHLSG